MNCHQEYFHTLNLLHTVHQKITSGGRTLRQIVWVTLSCVSCVELRELLFVTLILYSSNPEWTHGNIFNSCIAIFCRERYSKYYAVKDILFWRGCESEHFKSFSGFFYLKNVNNLMCAIVKPRPAMLKWGMVERAVIILHLAEAKYTDGKIYLAIWTNTFFNLYKYILQFGRARLKWEIVEPAVILR